MTVGENSMKRDFQTKERDNAYLRGLVDGDDRFFQGHGIKKLRDGGREPEPWMANPDGLKAFLSERFPLANEHCEDCKDYGGCGGTASFICEHHDYFCPCRSCRQYTRALVWMFAIYHCFRRGVAAETTAVLWNGMFDADYEDDKLNAIEPV